MSQNHISDCTGHIAVTVSPVRPDTQRLVISLFKPIVTVGGITLSTMLYILNLYRLLPGAAQSFVSTSRSQTPFQIDYLLLSLTKTCSHHLGMCEHIKGPLPSLPSRLSNDVIGSNRVGKTLEPMFAQLRF